MKIVHFALFFIAFSLIYVGLHYYNASFYSRYFGFSAKLTKVFFLTMALLSIFSFLLKRKFISLPFEYLMIFLYSWMGAVLIFSFYFSICDLINLFLNRLNINFKFLPLFFLFLSFLSIVFSIYKATSLPELKRLELNSDFLKRNIRIAVISDIHIDFEFKKKLFFKTFDGVINQKPDVIIFLGDLLDPGFNMTESELFQIAKTSIPLIGVFGNHEYYYGIDKSIDVYQKMGIKLLRNNSFSLRDINFIGFGDIKTENISEKEALQILAKNYQPDKFNIILSHQPLYFDAFAQNYKFVMLSGHTHRGQIFPFGFLTRLAYKYFYGIYSEKDSFLYVMSGTGTWGPPMRFLSSSEWVLLTLKK